MTTRAAQAERERSNRLLLRARDLMDRSYAEPLDVDALARVAHCSPAHFIRTFRAAFGETPYRYLQRRRIERAMALLRRGDLSVTDICFEVGFSSLGTFSTRFTELVGVPPSAYRDDAPVPEDGAAEPPSCVTKKVTRPVRRGGAQTSPDVPAARAASVRNREAPRFEAPLA